MNKMINCWIEKFHALTVRERIFIFIGILLLLYFVWKSILYGCILSTEEDLKRRLDTVKQQVSALQDQSNILSGVISNNPIPNLNNQLNALKAENTILESTIKTKTNKMIEPKEMIAILKNLVEQTKNLSIIKMESLAPKVLFKPEENQSSQTKAIQVYEHPFKMEISGGFHEVYDFLKKIEDRKMNIFWDELIYEVETYPKAIVKITVHTLSLQEGFVGV